MWDIIALLSAINSFNSIQFIHHDLCGLPKQGPLKALSFAAVTKISILHFKHH